MIITIKGADFSTKNIGTLSTWTILTNLGSGATYSGNRLVDKGGSLSATITIADGYELGSAGVSVIMGTTDVTSSASTVNGNIITISISTVTGNVTIKVPTLNTATGEEDSEVTYKSLTEINQSLQMYTPLTDSVNAPTDVTQSTDFIQIAPSSTTSRLYFSNIPLTPGSEVEITSTSDGTNYAIGFESDISTDDWASRSWKGDTSSIVLPESHLWIITKEETNDTNKIAYLERLTNAYKNATPTASTSELHGTDGRYTLKVLNNGFEAYKDGVKVYTMTSGGSNPYITHTTTPVYFCFATATSASIKIHSIIVA